MINEIEQLEDMLVDSIKNWMSAHGIPETQYWHGHAQGVARALSVLKTTDLGTEWEAGLDHYQNDITIGRE